MKGSEQEQWKRSAKKLPSSPAELANHEGQPRGREVLPYVLNQRGQPGAVTFCVLQISSV